MAAANTAPQGFCIPMSEITHLYRFRPIAAVLDRHEELARQEIYFSPPTELNDPMEGYKDVFWSGDRVVWHNLFRHYILCLLQTASLCLLLGPTFDPGDLKTIIFAAFENLPQAPVRAIYERARERFFADPNIGNVVDALPQRETPLRRDELTHMLRAVHPLALFAVMNELRREGIEGIFRDLDSLRARAEKMAETIARVAAMKPSEQEMAEALFSASELTMTQMELIQAYNTPFPPEGKGVMFLTRDFPAAFVRALDELIHPPCFIACFVADPTNASMWATYGDSQKGVCLKFKTMPDNEGHPSLALEGVNGWRGPQMEPIRTFLPRRLLRVNYSEVYPEIDFFNSIGRLPIPLLNSVWYHTEQGERSACSAARALNAEEWSKAYWKAFEEGATRKTDEWVHEQEYRILLWSHLTDLNEQPLRKLRYRFSDLTGIIFGAHAAEDNKLKIMKIIEEKCRAENRFDFEFHQVQYSRKDRSFRIAPLALLRFNQA